MGSQYHALSINGWMDGVILMDRGKKVITPHIIRRRDKAMLAQDMFKMVYGNSRNMMTPDIIRYYQYNEWAVELSTGTSLIDGDTMIYGVSVVHKNGTHKYKGFHKVLSFSLMTHSEQTARDYITGRLRDKMRVYSLRAKTRSRMSTNRPSIAAKV
jgi:hypothetical protein